MHDLIEHGKEHVWCTPGMDKQAILALARLTKNRGIKNYFDTDWKIYPLPKRNKVYHVFMIGHIPKIMLGVATKVYTNTWYRLEDLMNQNDVLFNVYFGNGLEIPRASVSLLISEYRGILVCIESNSSLQVLSSGKVFFRVYKNSYFSSSRVDPSYRRIECSTISDFSNLELSDFIEDHKVKNNRDYGLALACVKGIWYSELDERFINNTDVIDSVFDGSVRDVITFKIPDLIPFVSVKDKLQKYLIHIPKVNNDGTIQYFDDNEIYIGHSTEFSAIKAIRLTLNDVVNVRQLTHNDYSVSVDQIALIKQLFFNDIDPNEMCLWVITRDSGYLRDLWFVNDRIRALYKLSDTDLSNVLLGIDSNVYFWRADYLESGYYAGLMGTKYNEIDLPLVSGCYGLRGIAKAIANTPLFTDMATDNIIDLPENFHQSCLIIEYRSNGTFLDIYQSNDSSTYGIYNVDCAWIEIIKGSAGREEGKTGNETYTGFNEASFKVRADSNYDFYKTTKDNKGNPNNDQWINVTDSNDYYIEDGQATWSISLEDWSTVAIGDMDVYWQRESVEIDVNRLEAKLVVDVNKGGETDWRDDYVHMAHYRIWLNDKALIRDIDFKIMGSTVYIVNKQFLEDALESQKIEVIGDGVIKHNWLNERGYVEFNGISFNEKYDYYDDRLVRCISGGSVYPIDLIRRPESDKEEGIVLTNGAPYIVENVTSALKDEGIDYGVLEDDCREREDIIGNYLTLKNTENKIIELDSSSDYFLLYSPFMATIIFDIHNCNIVIPKENLNDIDLDILLKKYKYLLDVDPCTWDLDYRHFSIDPHPFYHDLSITSRQYSILDRVNAMYLKNLVNLSSYLTFSRH